MTKASTKQAEETQGERNQRLLEEARAQLEEAQHAATPTRDRIAQIDREIEAHSLRIGSAARAGQPIAPLQAQADELRAERKRLEADLPGFTAAIEAAQQLVTLRSGTMQEAQKQAAHARLPQAIAEWAEVLRENRPLLEEIRDLTKFTLAPVRFGHGLMPDLENPVIGPNRFEI